MSAYISDNANKNHSLAINLHLFSLQTSLIGGINLD